MEIRYEQETNKSTEVNPTQSQRNLLMQKIQNDAESEHTQKWKIQIDNSQINTTESENAANKVKGLNNKNIGHSYHKKGQQC